MTADTHLKKAHPLDSNTMEDVPYIHKEALSTEDLIESLLSEGVLDHTELKRKLLEESPDVTSARMDRLFEPLRDHATSQAESKQAQTLRYLHTASLVLLRQLMKDSGHVYQQPISFDQHRELDIDLRKKAAYLKQCTSMLIAELEDPGMHLDPMAVQQYIHNLRKFPSIAETKLRERGPLISLTSQYRAMPGDILVSLDNAWYIVTDSGDGATVPCLKTNEARVLYPTEVELKQDQHYLVRSHSTSADLALLSFEETEISAESLPPNRMPLGYLEFQHPCSVAFLADGPHYYIQRGDLWFESNSIAIQPGESRRGQDALFDGIEHQEIIYTERPLYARYALEEELILGVIRKHDALAIALAPQYKLQSFAHRGQQELSRDLDYCSDVLAHSVSQLLPGSSLEYNDIQHDIRDIHKRAGHLFHHYAVLAKYIPAHQHLPTDDLSDERRYPAPEQRSPYEMLTIVHKHMLHPRIVDANKEVHPDQESLLQAPYRQLIISYNEYMEALNSLLHRLNFSEQTQPQGVRVACTKSLQQDIPEYLVTNDIDLTTVTERLENGARLLTHRNEEGVLQGVCLFSSPEVIHNTDPELFSQLPYKERIAVVHTLSVATSNDELSTIFVNEVRSRIPQADLLLLPEHSDSGGLLPLSKELQQRIPSLSREQLFLRKEAGLCSSIDAFEARLARISLRHAERILLANDSENASRRIDGLMSSRQQLHHLCMQAKLLLQEDTVPEWVRQHIQQYTNSDWLPETDYSYEQEQAEPLLQVFADIHYECMLIESYAKEDISRDVSTPLPERASLSTRDVSQITGEERRELCIKLSKLTEQNPYRSGDPRTRDFGASVTFQPPALFESMIERGARVRICENSDKQLLGYVLFLPPEATRLYAPEVTERYKRYGESGYIYFVVSDPEVGNAPVYSLLMNAVAFDQPQSDISVGRVLEDNYRGILIHTCLGGGTLIAGDQKNIKTNLPYTGAQDFELMPESKAFGMILPTTPRWKAETQKLQRHRREAFKEAELLVKRELPGATPNTWEELLSTWRKRSVLDTYVQDLEGRERFFKAIASSESSEQLQQNLAGWGPHWKNILKLTMQRTIPAYKVASLQEEKFWEQLDKGEDLLQLMSSLPSYTRRGMLKSSQYIAERYSYINWDQGIVQAYANQVLGSQRASSLKMYLLKTPLNDPILGFQTE